MGHTPQREKIKSLHNTRRPNTKTNRLYMHKKLNLANNLCYRKLIVFKNQLVPRQSDAVDCNCYRQTTTKVNYTLLTTCMVGSGLLFRYILFFIYIKKMYACWENVRQGR